MESVALGVYQTPQNKTQNYWALVGAGTVNYIEGEISETEQVEFKTIKEEDPTLDKGIEKVKQNGKDGQILISYEVTYEDGIEVKRVELDKKKTDPIDEIILIGTKPEKTLVTETEETVLPFETITQYDAELELGKVKTIKAGTPGKLTITYKVTYLDGLVLSKEEIKREQIDPVARVIIKGTKLAHTDHHVDAEEPKQEIKETESLKNNSNKEQDKVTSQTQAKTKNQDKAGSSKQTTKEKMKNKLPETATNFWDNLLTGSLVLLTGLFGLYLTRRF